MNNKKILSIFLIMALLLSSTMFSSSALADDEGPAWEDPELLLWYQLNGNVNNSSRYTEYDGSITGNVTFVDDPSPNGFGTVMSLPGGSQGSGYVTIPGTLGSTLRDGAGKITVTTWVYNRNTSSQTYRRVFDFGRGQTQNFYAAFLHASGTGSCAKITTGGSGSEQTVWYNVDGNRTRRFTQNAWQHVAVTYDSSGKSMKLYVDGVLNGETTTTSLITDLFSATAANNRMYIGRSQYGDNDANALYKDFRVYSRELSADDVRTVMNSVFDPETIVKSDVDAVIAGLGTLTDRTTDFTLPSFAASGTRFVWSTEPANSPWLNAATGAVTRPPSNYSEDSVTVNLTVKGTFEDETYERTVQVTIPKMPTPEDIVASDKAALTIETVLSGNVVLPTAGQLGSVISWVTSDAGVITANGVVTRPAIGQPNATATLTATISYEGVQDTKVFNITVKALTEKPQLTGISRVAVTTVQGFNPRIPFNVPGEWEGTDGGNVRVNWTVPTTVSSVYNSPGVTSLNQAAAPPNAAYSGKANIFVVSSNSYGYFLNTYGDFDVCTDIVKSGDNFNVAVRAANESGNEVTGRALYAIYDSEGKLVKTDSATVSLASKGNGSAALNGVEIPEGCTAKIFAWDDATTAPLAADVAVPETAVNYDPPERSLAKFDLADMRLENYANGNQTIFQQNQDNMLNELLDINPDTYLYTFRIAYGLPTGGITNPGGDLPSNQLPTSWDELKGKLKGHGTGHYLSGLAQVYESIDDSDPRKAMILERMNYLIDELYMMSTISKGDPKDIPGYYDPLTSGSYITPSSVIDTNGKCWAYYYNANQIRQDWENWGEGYISAYPPDQFVMLEKGRPYSWVEDDPTTVWAPYYTLHKLMNGFINLYAQTGNPKGLEMAENMGRWVYRRLSQLPQSTLSSMWNTNISGEYGGMNDVMAAIYELSDAPDKEVFMNCAKLFDNTADFYGSSSGSSQTGGIYRNADTIRGKHANQRLPQYTGMLKIYDATVDAGVPDNKYYTTAENFWNLATDTFSWAPGGFGGNSNNSEAFTQQPNYHSSAGGLRSTDSSESCGMYNILKLSTQLFLHDQDTKYMDYYERTLYNGIAGGIATSGARNTYHNPVYRGAARSFGGATRGSTCCGGTARESHTKYCDSIYFRALDDSALYVNLYIPSTLNWERADADPVKVNMSTNYPYGDDIKLTINGSGEFDVMTRIPSWAESYSVTVNGVPYDTDVTPGTYAKISGNWKDGDVIEINLPVVWHFLDSNQDTSNKTFFFGPYIMAGTESEAGSTLTGITVDGGDFTKSITNFNRDTLTCNISGISFKPYVDYRPGATGNASRCSVYYSVGLSDD